MVFFALRSNEHRRMIRWLKENRVRVILSVFHGSGAWFHNPQLTMPTVGATPLTMEDLTAILQESMHGTEADRHSTLLTSKIMELMEVSKKAQDEGLDFC